VCKINPRLARVSLIEARVFVNANELKCLSLDGETKWTRSKYPN
jgi:hypothetical protein